jgi:transcriptional regulator with PAS, ATPase and Fis domain
MISNLIIYSLKTSVHADIIDFKSHLSDKLEELQRIDQVVVCLLSSSCLPEFKKQTDVFADAGTRKDSRQLTRFFNPHFQKPAFMHGENYKDFGHMQSGVDAFLEHTKNWKSRNLFFVCLPEEIFEAGLKEVTKVKVFKERKKQQYEDPLLNLIDPTETPFDLKTAYIGDSEPCLLVRQMIGVAAKHDFPVLILGESGTGKEVVARTIHQCSDRNSHSFIPLNCGAIPTELFESELFGYLKDSHSKAAKDKIGLWQVANHGTLFLDEIGDLMPYHQVKVLKAIEDGEIWPVGATKPVPVNVRIIAATNKDIESLRTEKKQEFRQDLYYRVSTFIIRTPPLSSHPEDIPALAKKIWIDIDRKNKDNPLPNEVLDYLIHINWPGNVRSIKHFLQRVFALFEDQQITRHHLEVLHHQDLHVMLDSFTENRETSADPKDFEKAVLKMEYLLKAALYSESNDQRRKLLIDVRASLDEHLNTLNRVSI